MDVLVPGGTGFVGSSLCAELAARGHDVTALSRNPEEASFDADVATARGDLTDYDDVSDHFAGRDAVVQLVALSPLFRPSGGSQRHVEVHLGGTENAVRAAEAHDVDTFLQVSGVHADPDADTAYLQAKGEAETVVRASNLNWIVVRPTVLFGEGDEIRPFTKLVAPPYVTPLPGGGSQRFQLLWVEDVAEMMADALEGRTGDWAGADDGTRADDGAGDGTEATAADRNPHVGETYELGGPSVQTFAEIVELVWAAEGRSVHVVPVPTALADLGLGLLGAVGGPLGSDQARSLRRDLVADPNDVGAFGRDPADLTGFAAFLGAEEET